jgi:succinate dehydrogenase / fumarate reductase flavoprotein subunit
MGGVPTNVESEVLRNNTDVVPGLFAAGEVACVSVHGSNRLGTNSLLDINVFGRRAGIAAAEYAAKAKMADLPENPQAMVEGMVSKLLNSTGTEKVGVIRAELQETMDRNAQVFRTEESLLEAQEVIKGLRKRYERVSVTDKGKRYNSDLLEAIELGFLIDLAEVLVVGALNRKESRGGHQREDHLERDDVNYMQHTMAYRESDGEIRLDWKPVVVTRYQPMARKY